MIYLSILKFGNHDRLAHPDNCLQYFSCLKSGNFFYKFNLASIFMYVSEQLKIDPTFFELIQFFNVIL